MVKTAYTQYNIGKCKYVVSFHDGVQTHKDASPFFGIATFSNKKKLGEFQGKLMAEGYAFR